MLPSKVIHHKARRSLPLLLASLLFAGCTVNTPQPPVANMQESAIGTSDYYLQQMQQSSDNNKVGWQLLAIRALLHEGKLPQASQQLAQIPGDLNKKTMQEKYLLQAQLAIAHQNLPIATKTLLQIDAQLLSKTQRSRYYQLQIAAAGNQPTLDTVRTHIQLQPLLATPQEQQANIDSTWQALNRISPATLKNITIKANENILQGWLDLLSMYYANNTDPNKLKTGIKDWQQRYPNNPAASALPTALSQARDLQPASVNKIALLLPLNGQAQVFAKTIQQGFNDARNGVLPQAVSTPAVAAEPQVAEADAPDAKDVISPADADTDTNVANETPASEQPSQPVTRAVTTAAAAAPTTQLQVYDTSAQPIEQILTQAQNDGATLVVGPLLKSQVEKAASSQSPLNILALNEPETIQNHPNLCYFALSPEDEARDAAHHMWQQGKRAPLLLLPRGSLGTRVSKAFATEWQKLGGNIVLQQPTGSLAELHQKINSGAGISLSGTPVALQPTQPAATTLENLPQPAASTTEETATTPATSHAVDAVYIVASQAELGLIKPLITMRIGSRSNVHLYASSRSHQAGAGPDYRLEVDGLQFSDIPLLSGANPALMQQAVNKFGNDYSLVRLYAMGIDAWTLANHFSEIRKLPAFHIQGNTGTLHSTQDCVINRTLSWSQYHQGQIIPAS